MNKKQSGFTLIEIAIVLVIIGLLLGGVLKGQEMITNGKLKRAVNDTNGVAAAYYSYLDRYAAFPGDDPNAGTRWIGGIQGDGNGAIDTGQWDTDGGDEASYIWLHLRSSGLVSGPTTDDAAGRAHPVSSFGGIIGVQDGNYGLTGAVMCMSSIDGKYAEILDFQLDDGDATTGSMRGNLDTARTAAGSVAYAAETLSSICYQL